MAMKWKGFRFMRMAASALTHARASGGFKRVAGGVRGESCSDFRSAHCLAFGSMALMIGLLASKAECDFQAQSQAYDIDGFVRDLRVSLRDDQIQLDLSERQTRGKPWNSYHHIEEIPHIIVLPESTEQVSVVVKLCNKYSIPIVPFGGGTSLEGQTLALKGGVSLDFNQMKGIVALNEQDLDVTVQAGVGYIELNELLRPLGLWFPLDPGPGASIGGMCACRCSGSTAVRYGSMRENVLSLTAVLSTGEVIVTGARARKCSAGYDIARLLIGSEGTLGIITEATLKIHNLPKVSHAIRICYPSKQGIVHAANTAKDTLSCGVTIGRCELLDEEMIRIINASNAHRIQPANDKSSVRLPWPESTTLLYEITGLSQASVAEQAQIILDIARKHGGQDIAFYSQEEDCKEVWKIRKECLWSAMSMYPDREPMITDVCVPLSHLPTLIMETKAVIERSPLPCQIIAHAGDGNFHVLIFFKPDDPKEVKMAKDMADAMALRAIELDGTCTGEHGVGVGKKHLLTKELNPEMIDLMQRIKHTMDPKHLLNPGKVIDVPDNALCSPKAAP